MDDALRHEDADDQADRFADADACFHRHLIHAGGSLLLNHLSEIVTQGLTVCAEPTTCDRTKAAVARHQTVADALRKNSSRS
ncbi:FCD domain-containing protein [Streptomyces odontomachi]|uniref:FCD domain-containing protein n=1 Tax=Streptomyces odontomachi TaxID=2944940 RepID=UPI00210BA412|nr:FCD domain-containing protein [Streptomyces sp. ODS25]